MPDPTSQSERDAAAQWWTALRRTVLRVIDALEAADRSDPSFRQDLSRVLGLLGAESVEPKSPSTISEPEPDPSDAVQTPAPETPGPRFLEAPLPSGLIGPKVVTPPPPSYPKEWTADSFDPARIANRCRIKARATRWQTERSRRLDAGEDVTDGDTELRNTAREKAVFLWMINPTKWRDRTPAAVDIVAGCYDALADAVELMALSDQLRREQESAMRLLGEAQSSVRAAVEGYASTRRDEDQEAVFTWLRRETDVRRVYVEYMQLDSPAPPENHADLRQRIATLRRSLDDLRGRDQNVEKAIQKLKYHAGKIDHRPPGERVATDPSHDSDFAGVASAVERLLAAGVPPSDTRLREALRPVLDRFPEDESAIPPVLSRVLGAIQDYLDQREADEEDRARDPEDSVDPLVGAARGLVEGRDAVLIGGIPAEAHRRKLQMGLGLRSLNWIRIEHHASFDDAESAIRRPGVNLVLIMTRWRSHRDGPEARAVCKELGIPLIELPAGYNLRQVAHRIVEQMPMAQTVNA